MEIVIRRVSSEDHRAWFDMRQGIWPEAPEDYLRYDMNDILSSD